MVNDNCQSYLEYAPKNIPYNDGSNEILSGTVASVRRLSDIHEENIYCISKTHIKIYSRYENYQTNSLTYPDIFD